jgi:hypothetical protein
MSTQRTVGWFGIARSETRSFLLLRFLNADVGGDCCSGFNGRCGGQSRMVLTTAASYQQEYLYECQGPSGGKPRGVSRYWTLEYPLSLSRCSIESIHHTRQHIALDYTYLTSLVITAQF